MNFPEFYQTLLTPRSEITRRISGFQKKLVEMDLEAALIYHQVDLFYFSGTMSTRVSYLSRPREIPSFWLKNIFPEPGRRSPLERIELLPSAGGLAETLRYHEFRHPGTAGAGTGCPAGRRLSDFWKNNSNGKRPWISGPSSGASGRSNRILKLGQMRKAGDIGRQVYREVAGDVPPGLSEIALAGLDELRKPWPWATEYPASPGVQQRDLQLARGQRRQRYPTSAVMTPPLRDWV